MKVKTNVKAGEGMCVDPNGQAPAVLNAKEIHPMRVRTSVKAGSRQIAEPDG